MEYEIVMNYSDIIPVEISHDVYIHIRDIISNIVNVLETFGSTCQVIVRGDILSTLQSQPIGNDQQYYMLKREPEDDLTELRKEVLMHKMYMIYFTYLPSFRADPQFNYINTLILIRIAKAKFEYILGTREIVDNRVMNELMTLRNYISKMVNVIQSDIM
jgi:hypothetical protein